MRKELEAIVLRLWGRFCGFLVASFVIFYFVMSKKSQRRKRHQHRQQVQENRKNNKEAKAALRAAKRAAKAAEKNENNANNNNTDTCGNTSSKGRRDPIGVGEITKHSSNVNTTTTTPSGLTINTCFPNKYYKVFRKPSNWTTGDCPFVDLIGYCMATDHEHGAKLTFISGQSVFIGFDALEFAEHFRPQKIEDKIIVDSPPPMPFSPVLRTITEDTVKVTTVDKPKIVTSESAKKGSYYEVIKRPERWKTGCKFVGRIGLCILIDDRGIRLRFSDGDDVSFEPDCLKEAEAIDLNNVTEITEDNVRPGELFRVIARPKNFGEDAITLIGKVGKSKWANYRGVCLKFEDGAGYIISFDCLERISIMPKIGPNPVKVSEKLNASNVVIGRKYKFAKIPEGWGGDRDLLGEMAVVKWASDVAKGVRMIFKNKSEYTIPFDCIEDLPRPDDLELIFLIRKHPERILKIIKGLNHVTKLPPVRKFIETGELPQPTSAPTPIPENEFIGPILPVSMSETLPIVGSLKIENNVMALIGPIRSTTESGNPS